MMDSAKTKPTMAPNRMAVMLMAMRRRSSERWSTSDIAPGSGASGASGGDGLDAGGGTAPPTKAGDGEDAALTDPIECDITSDGDPGERRTNSCGGVSTVDPDGGIGGTPLLSYYRDCMLQDETVVSYQLSDISDVHDWLGRTTTDENTYFNGTYDEFRIYDRPLSSNDVVELYNYIPEPATVSILALGVVLAQLPTCRLLTTRPAAVGSCRIHLATARVVESCDQPVVATVGTCCLSTLVRFLTTTESTVWQLARV